MIYKNKKQKKRGLRSFLDGSDKIKAITKTRYFNELEKIKGKDKMFNYILSNLEGKDVETELDGNYLCFKAW